jgi:hypothetical protein
VLGAKIAQRQQLLPAARRLPFAKAPIAKGVDRDQHNLWDTAAFYGVAKRHIAERRFTPGGRRISISGNDRRKYDDSHSPRALQPEVSPETRRCHSR